MEKTILQAGKDMELLKEGFKLLTELKSEFMDDAEWDTYNKIKKRLKKKK